MAVGPVQGPNPSEKPESKGNPAKASAAVLVALKTWLQEAMKF